MSYFQFVVQFFYWVALIVLAIKFLLPKSNWIEVCSLVYNGALFSIFLAAYLGFVDFPLLFLISPYLIIMLGIGSGLTMFMILKKWDSWKK